MSGGSLDYFYYKLEKHIGDFNDKELDELVKDLAQLFHDREWYIDGDYGEWKWNESRDNFKQKWFDKEKKNENTIPIQTVTNAEEAEAYPMKGEEQPTGYWACIEDDNYAGGGYWECPSCAYRFSFQGFNLLNDMPYCPKCGNRVQKMTQQMELTYDELFLLVMAVDEVLWRLDENTPSYHLYQKLNEILYAQLRQLKRKEINNA